MSLGKLARWMGVFLIPLLAIPLATCTPDEEVSREASIEAVADEGGAVADDAAVPDEEAAGGLAAPPPSPPGLIVSNRRRANINVGGRAYGRGNHRPPPDSAGWEPGDPGRIGIPIQVPGLGTPIRPTMSDVGLDSMRVYVGDAEPGARPVALIYGIYDNEVANQAAIGTTQQSVVGASIGALEMELIGSPEAEMAIPRHGDCIWCGQILVCGVEPNCN